MKVQRILAIIILLLTACSAAWCAPVTTYIAEFSVSGVNKPEEMKATIQTLLLSRMSGEKIATVNKPDGAQIKVTGSYLQSGTIFSLDAVAQNSTGAVVARAFSQGKNQDELIPAVGSLAKSLYDGIAKGSVSAVTTSSLSLPADVVKPVRTVQATGQTVHRMDGALSGIAIGRTLPEGERELFIVGNRTLRYYRQGAELTLMAKIPYRVHERVISVDTADLDNDNVPEIYVTVLNGEMLASQVWVVDGTSLKQIAGPLPYFFRAVTGAGGVKKLYAQQISGNADFAGEVSEVVKSGSSYKLVNPVKLPKLGYLYNFNVLKNSKGEASPVIFDRSGFLKLFSPAGDELWKSSEEFSGSETFFNRSDLDSLRNSGSAYRRVYLDQRIIVKPDGELLVPKNSATWFMLNKHSYAHNSLYCFSTGGSYLEEKWHTSQSDFYLADFGYDAASRELLMLEVVAKEEGIFDKGASRLVIRKLD